jgi:deoxyribonuclease V
MAEIQRTLAAAVRIEELSRLVSTICGVDCAYSSDDSWVCAAAILLLCDGHGVAHPRGCGLACFIGLWLNAPTIGVAKRCLHGEFEEPGKKRGDRSPLMAPTQSGSGDRLIGAALRSRTGCRSLFVSPGHRISHEQAGEWVLRTSMRARLPEPLRLAHEEARRMARESG